jgi:hypothetical protein
MKYFCLLLICFGSVTYAADDSLIVSRFLQYKNLQRITDEKINVSESVASLCADPFSRFGPHIKPGIHIYANQIAIEEKKKDSTSPSYPIGALFIKEKFEAKDNDEPSIITVMEKVANKGTVNDWQFYMIRLSDKTIVHDGFKASCVDCHGHFEKFNFVSPQTDSLLSEYTKKAKVQP